MLTAALLLTSLAPAQAAEDTPTDAIVWQVGSRVVTLSDVALEDALSVWDAASSAPWNLRARPVEDRLVDAALVRDRAGDSTIYRPAPSDVTARLRALRLAAGEVAWEAFLGRWGLRDTDVEAILFRRMVVERYVLRTLSARLPVGDTRPEAVAAAYAAWVTELRAELPAQRTGST